MRIGMIIAIAEEIGAFLETIGEPLESETVYGVDVRRYRVGENELIAVKSGAGEVYAAAAAQLLIVKYDVDMIVNFGICGGLREGMSVKHAVVVDGVVHYNFDTSAFDNCEIGRHDGYSSVIMPLDKRLADAAVEAEPSLGRAICASGDKFVADPDEKRDLADRFDADICEMEAAGIVLTADRAGVPVLMIKAVSDSVDGGAEECFAMAVEAAKCCVIAALKAIERLK